ncbi:MAG: hypothetical protein P8X64_15675 [Anaerolineales bacterium]
MSWRYEDQHLHDLGAGSAACPHRPGPCGYGTLRRFGCFDEPGLDGLTRMLYEVILNPARTGALLAARIDSLSELSLALAEGIPGLLLTPGVRQAERLQQPAS